MKTAPYWYPLWRHMLEEHGMTLTDSELHEIVNKVDECKNGTLKLERRYKNLLSKIRKERIAREKLRDLQKIKKKEKER